MYAKVNLTTYSAELVESIPTNIRGLSQCVLNALEEHIVPCPEEYIGVGFWKVLEPGYDSSTHKVVKSVGAVDVHLCVVYLGIEELSEDELTSKALYAAKAELEVLDKSYNSRWLEDLHDGIAHESFLAWKARRQELRTIIAELTAE